MADDITNIVLLQHMQAMKSSLEVQISAVKSTLEQQIAAVDQKIDKNTQEMRTGFTETRQHLQALQEDLVATMQMLSRHEKKLVRL